MKYLFILVLIIPFVCIAEVYKWTDEHGRVHYGDSPGEKVDAEKMVIEVHSSKRVTNANVESYRRAESKQVTMYATSWCGYCKKARRYFKENRIDYVEYDIEKDKRAKRKYDLLGVKVFQ